MSKEHRADFNLSLNGYRGLCALTVFVYHMGSSGVAPWPSGTPFREGVHFFWSSFAYGVDMFFMISGFVILGSLLRHATVGSFLKDRAIRIFSAWIPALIAVTLVCSILRMKMFADVTPLEGLGMFAANLVLLPPLVPVPMIHFGSWSLTYEWVFYLTAALGAVLSRRGEVRSIALVAWAAAAATFICLYPRSIYFLTGVIVFHHQAWFERHRRWLRFPIVSFVVFLVAWRATEINRAELSDTLIDFALDGRWVYVAIAFLASLHMFASVCLNASRQTHFLVSRAFQFLGTVSYSFYLWHALVMSLGKRIVNAYVVPEVGVPLGFAIFTVTCLVVGLAVSWASWLLFEVHLAKWARRTFAPRPAIGGPVHVP